jgi:hypothetical protein
VRLLDFNGDLKMAGSLSDGLELAYQSSSRALAILDQRPAGLHIDGLERPLPSVCSAPPCTLLLPRGQHLVTIRTQAATHQQLSATR